MLYDSLDQDTIAALCTAPGGALAILRISGPLALEYGNQVWKGRTSLGKGNARKMLLGKVGSGESCLAVYMPNPCSYTGEDTVELHCHGGAFAPKRLLEAVLQCGARSAGPGEFTKRAFLNGKMDLTQAEAVADLINAKSRQALLLAEKQMTGLLGGHIRSLREKLLVLLLEMESRLDFPEEDLDWKKPQEYIDIAAEVGVSLEKLIRTSSMGTVLREGLLVAIGGMPNAGKSSLLNALLGYERAIVTEVAGTTRDTLEEFISLRGIPVRLTDTAGLRDGTKDLVEKMGIDRSMRTLEEAQMIFWVMDGSTRESAKGSAAFFRSQQSAWKDKNVIAVWNKRDMDHSPDTLEALPPEIPVAEISARTGEGLETLGDLFAEKVWALSGSSEQGSDTCEVSARHKALLEEALDRVRGLAALIGSEQWELAASDLRSALAALGTVTGEEIAPDVLEGIFSKFCIGK